MTADLVKLIRQRLEAEGVSAVVSERIEVELRATYGGERVSIAKRSAEQKQRIRELMAAGVPARTARRKITGR